MCTCKSVLVLVGVKKYKISAIALILRVCSHPSFYFMLSSFLEKKTVHYLLHAYIISETRYRWYLHNEFVARRFPGHPASPKASFFYRSCYLSVRLRSKMMLVGPLCASITPSCQVELGICIIPTGHSLKNHSTYTFTSFYNTPEA